MGDTACERKGNIFTTACKWKVNRFTICCVIAVFLTVVSTSLYGCNDKNSTALKEKHVDTCLINSFPKINVEHNQAAQRLVQSMYTLIQDKTNALDDANEYYMYLYIFTVTLTMSSILGVLILSLVVKVGWSNSSKDLKRALLFTVGLSSFLYMMPHIMKNEENFAGNIKVSYSLGKQLIYSTEQYSRYGSIDSVQIDSLFKKVADSNYTVLRENKVRCWDISTVDAYRYYTLFHDDNNANDKKTMP